MPYYYAFSVFLSVFLLFQVQPMIGKYILPWFGGTPTVWSTVLLFFQILLTGGYAYAYALLGRLRERPQRIVHLVVLGASVALLLITALTWPSPLTPDASWRQAGNALPIWGILKVLAVAVGAPYFLLSSNSTLMQAWATRDANNRAPYHLYALSNAGSLLALLSYPLLFEPNLSLRTQAYVWSAGYVLFALSVAYVALRARQKTGAGAPAQSSGALAEPAARPSAGVYALWIGLAACASALLISVTSQITQEVAVAPFLWIAPLTVYLVTFILAFSGGLGYVRRLYLIAFFLLSFISLWMLVKYPPFSTLTQIIVYMLLLFIACMICHNELFRLRPDLCYLPSFYLMVAVGGAVGGVFVNLIAPLLFATGYWELQWGLVACGVLCAVILQRERPPASRKERRKSKSPGRSAPTRPSFKPAVIAAAGAALLMSIIIALIMNAFASDTLLARRNFYGVLRVWEINADDPKLRANQLTHGRTVHGFQFTDSALRVLPTTFYTEKSGVGLAFSNHPGRPGPLRVGALGLGIGVIAGYGQAGDVFRFYEIDPNVIRAAEGEGGYFSFLKDSDADVQVVPGDARVSLEQELATAGSQDFDLLVLDAFSGDAVPLHLLTKEAFEVYLKHLKPDGVIAINISNRFFNLDRAVYRLADALKLGAALIEDKGDGIQSYDSVWMLLARQRTFLQLPAIEERSATRPSIPARLRLWTDDFSNLLQVLK